MRIRGLILVLLVVLTLSGCRVTGEGMPRMLQYALNNRLFAEKGAQA